MLWPTLPEGLQYSEKERQKMGSILDPQTAGLVLTWLSAAVYVFVSYRLFILTGTLKDVVVPNKTGKEMARNFVTMAAFVAALFLAGKVIIAITGLTDLPNSNVAAVTQHFDP